MRLPPRIDSRTAEVALLGAGVAVAAIGVLGGSRGTALAGAAIALAAAAYGRSRHTIRPWRAFLASFALGCAALALTGQSFRADSFQYYGLLRSLAFDGNLDLANEWRVWGFPELPRSPTGLRATPYSIGPAVLWAPFLALAHMYAVIARALGGAQATDGYSAPYLGSMALGTLAVALGGAYLLARTLARRTSRAIAALAVAGTAAASPILYYVLVNPGMPHGLVFGLACACVWAGERAYAAPSAGRWAVLGALLGLIVAVRWQAAVFALFPIALGIAGLVQRRVSLRCLFAGVGAALLGFAPQVAAWMALYGTPLWIPRGHGLGYTEGRWFHWTSPRWFDVLLSADRGLLVTTPLMALALVGLLLALRRWGAIAAGGLLVFAATTWVNGALTDWYGGDAFLARRFDLVLPFLAIGLARLLEHASARPLVVPAVVLAAAVLWNAGLVRLHRARQLPEALGVEAISRAQAAQARRAGENAMGGVFGARGRAAAYKALVGEYLYWNLDLSGTIDLAAAGNRYVAGGWSDPENANGRPTFRWALFPRSCLRLPLDEPLQDLRAVVSARAPGRLERQAMTVQLNGQVLAQADLGREWQDVPFTLPKTDLVPGENALCFAFADALPEENGVRRAAAIARIQLP